MAIIIITIIIILVIVFIQGIYNYIPETNHVYRVYSVAAVLYLQFILQWMLFRVLNKFCTFTSALSALCVQCTIWLFFCISLISCFSVMLLRYCLTDCETVPVAPTITVINFVLTQYIYFKLILAYQLSGGGFPVNPDLNNRSKRFPHSTYWTLCAVLIRAIFCRSVADRWPVRNWRFWSNPFLTVSDAPIVTGTIFVFTFHTLQTAMSSSLHLFF